MFQRSLSYPLISQLTKRRKLNLNQRQKTQSLSNPRFTPQAKLRAMILEALIQNTFRNQTMTFTLGLSKLRLKSTGPRQVMAIRERLQKKQKSKLLKTKMQRHLGLERNLHQELAISSWRVLPKKEQFTLIMTDGIHWFSEPLRWPRT